MKHCYYRFVRPLCQWFLLPAMMSMATGLARADGMGPLLGDYVLGPGGTDQAWSVWVGGNFKTTGVSGKLQGRAFIRGNFIAESSLYNGYQIGNVAGGSNVLPDPSLPTLVVGGNISGTGKINTGAIILLGSLPIQVGLSIANNVTFTGLGTVITGGVNYVAADALRAQLSAKSSYWGSLPDTEGGSINATSWSLEIKGDGVSGNPKMWVFNLTRDMTLQPVLTGFETGDSILINCNKSGADDTFVFSTTSDSAFGDDLIPKVLWNFPDAAQVTISGSAGAKGSILLGNPNSVTTVSISSTNPHRGRFVSCGNVVHDGGGALYNYPLTMDFGPLSTQLDFSVCTAADGRVMIEISTANENGNHPIEVYAMIDGMLALVATVPSAQIIGFGSNTYIVEALGLTPGESYEFKIIDESGHIFESGLIEVAHTMVVVQAMALTPEMIAISFKTTPDLRYQVMVCEALGALWMAEYVQYPTARGWSKLSNQPFTAGPGAKTEVLVPRNNRAKAFFKIMQVP